MNEHVSESSERTAGNTARFPRSNCGNGLPKAASNAQTPVFADGAKEWNRSALLPEFAGRFAPQTPPTISPPIPGPVRENQFLRHGRVDFRHFGVFLLLRISVRPAGH